MRERSRHPVAVACYAGHRGEETPRRFTLAGEEVEVVAVVERWREPRERLFRVRGDDGRAYRLGQAVESGRWNVERER